MNFFGRIKKYLAHIGIFTQFVTLGALISVGMGVYLTNIVGPTLTQFTLGQQQLSFLTFVNRAAGNLLQPIDFVYPPKVESTKRLAEFTNRLQVPGLFRVKIWNTNGTIVYSDQKELIGKHYPPTEGFQKAMNLQSEIGITTFDPLNNYFFYEVAYREGIEAFTPIALGTTHAVVGVLETYTSSEFLDNEIRAAQVNLTRRIALSLLVMFVALSYIVRRASRTLDAQQRELNRYATGLELLVKERTRELERASGEQSRQSVELERKMIELAQAKAQDDSLLESIGEGMIAVDQEGKVVFMNEQAELLLGTTFVETVGKSCREVLAVTDSADKPVPSEKHPIGLALATQKKIKVSISAAPMNCRRKDGTAFPVAITVAPTVVNEILAGAVAIFRDVTREKEIDRTKTEFVSLVSHQLRTPLAIINWHAESLLSEDIGKLNPGQKNYIEEMYRGSKRMGTLVNAFLNVSRLELGTFIVEPVPMKVDEVARDVLKELTFSIKMKEIVIKERFEKKLSTIPADPKLVRIIIQNLLSNAVKYTPQKGKITITIEQKDKNETIGERTAYTDGILVTIADTGIGIPKKDERKIFSKLFRADNAQDKVAEGTGLGLYIVRSILDHAGGTIWFDSEEGKGTAFSVLFPLEGMKQREGTRGLA